MELRLGAGVARYDVAPDFAHDRRSGAPEPVGEGLHASPHLGGMSSTRGWPPAWPTYPILVARLVFDGVERVLQVSWQVTEPAAVGMRQCRVPLPLGAYERMALLRAFDECDDEVQAAIHRCSGAWPSMVGMQGRKGVGAG